MEYNIIFCTLGLFYMFGFTVSKINSQNTDSSVTCKGPEACVYDAIFTGYNKLTRPVNHYNKTVEVQLEFVFNALLDIDEKEEVMRVVGFFRAFWHDELLQWDPEDYNGVESITVPAGQIWLPDIGITNSVSRFYEFTYKRDFHLQINHNGHIRWSFGGILTTSCDINLNYYPFDNQRCDIEIESWQYEKNKIHLDLYPGNPVNLETTGDDPQWVLKKATGESYLKYDGRFSSIKFTLHWVRKPLYFYVNIILPGAYMAIITLGVFWLPIECGEKMSLGITVVLAFSVFQIVIMEITPVSSDAVPQITEMVVMVMTLATVSLLSSMFVSCLSDNETPPPRWAFKLFLHYIPRILRMSSYDIYKDEIAGKSECAMNGDVSKMDKEQQHPKRSTSGTSTKRDKSGQVHINNSLQQQTVQQRIEYLTLGKEESRHVQTSVTEILLLLEGIRVKMAQEERDRQIKEYWKYIGMAFDRLVFWVCFTVFATYFISALLTIEAERYTE